MRRHRRRFAIAVVVALAGCAPSAPSGSETPASVEPSEAPLASASPSALTAAFPIEAFADISEDPVSRKVAVQLQAILDDMAGGAGISATVMTANGTWSGATGKADGVRDVTVDDQFAIASITKSLVAAQVMQMVEAGELGLDDPAADHLPPDLDFDTNGATIRHLLGHRSGIPDYLPGKPLKPLNEDPQRLWKPAELLALVADDRAPVGETFEYANTNYHLLGLVPSDRRVAWRRTPLLWRAGGGRSALARSSPRPR